MADEQPIAINVAVDASALRRELGEAERLSRRFGSALGDALEGGIVRGRSLSDVLRGLGSRLSGLALSAALKPVESAFGSIVSGLVGPALGGGLSGGGVFGRLAQALTNSAGSAAVSASAVSPAIAPVTVNIATPDAESFRRSETQVSAALARAVSRGRRGL